jgi:hypothetical protein
MSFRTRGLDGFCDQLMVEYVREQVFHSVQVRTDHMEPLFDRERSILAEFLAV